MHTGSLDAVTNWQDWKRSSPLIDEDGEEVDLTDVVFEMFVCHPGDSKNAILTATTANGKITLPTSTTFQWWFTPEDMSNLCAGTYDVFLRVTIDDEVTPILCCQLPVVEGGPTS